MGCTPPSTCSVGRPLLTARSTPTASGCSSSGSRTGSSTTPRSGTTPAPSPVKSSGARSTSFRRAFLASRSVWRVGGKGKRTNATVGHGSLGAFAKFDHATCSLRMSQGFLPGLMGTSVRYSQSFPPSGMTSGGRVYRLPNVEPPTSVTGYGSLLPTPSAVSYGTNLGGGAGRVGKERPSLQHMARHNMWPTTQDAKNNGGPAQQRRNTPPLNALVGGPLNPDWVEWLMGWPIGSSALQPLETESLRSWLRLHGVCWGLGREC